MPSFPGRVCVQGAFASWGHSLFTNSRRKASARMRRWRRKQPKALTHRVQPDSRASRRLPERTLVSSSVTWDQTVVSRTTVRGGRCRLAKRHTESNCKATAYTAAGTNSVASTLRFSGLSSNRKYSEGVTVSTKKVELARPPISAKPNAFQMLASA